MRCLPCHCTRLYSGSTNRSHKTCLGCMTALIKRSKQLNLYCTDQILSPSDPSSVPDLSELFGNCHSAPSSILILGFPSSCAALHPLPATLISPTNCYFSWDSTLLIEEVGNPLTSIARLGRTSLRPVAGRAFAFLPYLLLSQVRWGRRCVCTCKLNSFDW